MRFFIDIFSRYDRERKSINRLWFISFPCWVVFIPHYDFWMDLLRFVVSASGLQSLLLYWILHLTHVEHTTSLKISLFAYSGRSPPLLC